MFPGPVNRYHWGFDDPASRTASFNLSGDKDRVLKEAFRVLKPDGCFTISDVVVRGNVPAEIKKNVELWIGCVAGALSDYDYVAKLAKAGFDDIDYRAHASLLANSRKRICIARGLEIRYLSKYEKTVKCIGPTATAAEIDHWKDEVLFSPQLDELAEFLNLVGNSTRLKIVFLLTEFKELCVCDLAQILDVTVPAVSQQLAKLKAFGLLKSRRESQTIFYSIADTRNVKLLKGRFDQILDQTQ